MMKSHPYASKRRLTNICCLIVSFGLMKFIFASYVLAGGELFEFTAKKELSPKASIIAREQQQISINPLGQDNIGQDNLAQNNVGQDNLAQNNLAQANITQNNLAQNNVTQNNVGQDNLAQDNLVAQNQSLNELTASTASHSRVSFLPRSQKNDITHAIPNNVTNQQNPSTNQTAAQARAFNALAAQAASQATVQKTALSTTSDQATLAKQVTPENMLQAERTALAANTNRSDIVNNDIMFAKASSFTANTASAQRRANLLQNAFGQNLKDDAHALEGIEKQQSNYKATKSQAQNTSVKAKKSSSLFSFVGTAHAAEDTAEEPYIRPDENLNMPIPTPKVSPYSSPESLEYKQAELNRKEDELIALQQQMSSRMEELGDLEGRIGSMVQDANAAQNEKFQHLIDTYTSMKARKAAETLVTLDEGIAVRILSGMKGKQSGEIFSYMDSVQAARLSEAMAALNM